MEGAHMLGKPKFSCYKFKQLIFNNASSFKGTDYFINEDYSKETVAIRKEKWKGVKQIREQDKYSVLFYDKMVWGEKRSRMFFPFLQYDI